jgi:ABC transport system ATP-binding/permease protein
MLVTPQAYLELNSQGQTLGLNVEKDVHRLDRTQDWADLELPVGWEVCFRKQPIAQKEGKD